MKNKFSIIIFLCLLIAQFGYAQGILEQLEKQRDKEIPDYVMATFKSTRISIGHSVETRKKGALEISFMSRYWDVPQDNSNSFVADRMTARFGVDYSITDKLTIGIGTAAPSGIYDAFFKYRILQQRIDGKGSPFAITLFQNFSYRSRQFNGVEVRNDFFSRTAYTTQLLIAHKLNSNISFQVSPTFIHRSSSSNPINDHNHFAVGFGARYKLNNHVSLVSEYYYLANELESIKTYGAFALGANWEIGSLMLQFKMTNNSFFTEETFITQTTKNFNSRDGNLIIGFNAIYYIQL